MCQFNQYSSISSMHVQYPLPVLMKCLFSLGSAGSSPHLTRLLYSAVARQACRTTDTCMMWYLYTAPCYRIDPAPALPSCSAVLLLILCASTIRRHKANKYLRLGLFVRGGQAFSSL
jgi:hypothetical protein